MPDRKPTALRRGTGRFPGAGRAGDPRNLPGPTEPGRRIGVLDTLRGWALLGVFVTNMLDFAGPAGDTVPGVVATSWWDRAAELAVLVLGEGAFYSVFSFLFGVGFALQTGNAAGRSGSFPRTFARRMAALAVLGAVHHVLIWENDILFPYAVTGVVLLAFHRTRPLTKRRLVVSSVVLTWTGAAVVVALSASAASSITGAGAAAEVVASALAWHDRGYLDLVVDRLDDLVPLGLAALVVSVPWLLTLFLAGAWAVQTGRVLDWRSQGPFLRRVLVVAVPVALVAKGYLALTVLADRSAEAAQLRLPLSVIVGGPALGATWLCLLVGAMARGGLASRVLGLAAPLGRMALTNYLAQSVICVAVFDGFGLGWYGRFGVAATTGAALLVYGGQVVASRRWLAGHRMGPVEWSWRAVTYGRPPRWRLDTAPSARSGPGHGA